MKRVAIILLAAGASIRMGRSKQLLEINGKTLLQSSLEVISKLNEAVKVIVLGANAESHAEIVKSFDGVTSIVNSDWNIGIGSSLKAGIRHMLTVAPETNGALFVVCDQPYVTEPYLSKLIDQYTSGNETIVASGYGGTEGVPAIFDRVHFPELLALPDKEGAKKVINRNPGAKKVILFPEGAVDLDTPGDFENFKKTIDGKS